MEKNRLRRPRDARWIGRSPARTLLPLQVWRFRCAIRRYSLATQLSRTATVLLYKLHQACVVSIHITSLRCTRQSRRLIRLPAYAAQLWKACQQLCMHCTKNENHRKAHNDCLTCCLLLSYRVVTPSFAAPYLRFVSSNQIEACTHKVFAWRRGWRGRSVNCERKRKERSKGIYVKREGCRFGLTHGIEYDYSVLRVPMHQVITIVSLPRQVNEGTSFLLAALYLSSCCIVSSLVL
jgi:hypothetical protein